MERFRAIPVRGVVGEGSDGFFGEIADGCPCVELHPPRI